MLYCCVLVYIYIILYMLQYRIAQNIGLVQRRAGSANGRDCRVYSTKSWLLTLVSSTLFIWCEVDCVHSLHCKDSSVCAQQVTWWKDRSVSSFVVPTSYTTSRGRDRLLWSGGFMMIDFVPAQEKKTLKASSWDCFMMEFLLGVMYDFRWSGCGTSKLLGSLVHSTS